MLNLIAIGDPIIDTHVQIASDCDQCRVHEDGQKHLCFDYGAKIPIVDSFQALGGNAPNVAVAGVKLGLSSALISTIGSDSNGRMILEYLKKFGVSADLITVEHGANTRYSIILNYKTERTILSYSEKKKYIWPAPIPPAEWIYYTGLSEGFEAIQEKLVEHLAAHPTVKLAVNPGSYMLKYALPELREIVARADVLIINLEETEKILGKTREAEKTEAALIHELLALGAKEVVLTDGPRGAWAGSAEEIWFLPPYPVKVISKTGAGDAFSAAYLTARHAGHDIAHSLEWGTSNSCGVIQAHGPQAGLLNEAGIKKMMEKFSTIQPQTI